MFVYVASILLVITSNVFYHIAQKQTPAKANPFTALFVTYITAALFTLLLMPTYKNDRSFLESFKDLNWTSIVLGICVVGLEYGYIMVYRAGWNISLGALVANITLSLLLIPIGIFFYKEGFEPNKVVGAILCIIGLVIINK